MELEPNAARKQLEDEAARLREQRLADEARQAQQTLNPRRNQNRVSEPNLRRALSPPWLVPVALFCAILAITSFLMPSEEQTGDADDGARSQKLIFSGVMALLAGGALLYRATAISRGHSWLNSLPFPLEGFDRALGLGESVQSANLQLNFGDTAPALEVVDELVRGRLKFAETQSAVSSPGKGVLVVRVTHLSTESHNGPIAKWLKLAVNAIALDLHRGYPIARAEIRVTDTSEFHVPSGD